jgi:hypothetical protein
MFNSSEWVKFEGISSVEQITKDKEGNIIDKKEILSEIEVVADMNTFHLVQNKTEGSYWAELNTNGGWRISEETYHKLLRLKHPQII